MRMKWTQELDDKLVELLKVYTNREAAEKLGCSYQAVRSRVKLIYTGGRRFRGLTRAAMQDEIERLRAEIERLTRKLASRDALIDDHLRKIMHLENRVEEEHARAGVWLNATADEKLKVMQLQSDLEHVQGSDVGMMELLHAEKVRAEAAERRVEKLREALKCAEELAKDYAWTRQKDISFKPDLDDDSHFKGYAQEHAVMRFRRARAALAEMEKSDD